MGKVDDFGDFVGRHWGDVVGLFILGTGVALELIHAYAIVKWNAQLSGIRELSASLVLAAMGILKLRPTPKENGNGNGNGHNGNGNGKENKNGTV